MLPCLNRLLVVRGSFPVDKGNGPRGADGQAVAQPVAVIVAQEFRFTIYHSNGALVAGLCTQAAAVTFFFIDLYNFPYHKISSFNCKRFLTLYAHYTIIGNISLLYFQRSAR